MEAIGRLAAGIAHDFNQCAGGCVRLLRNAHRGTPEDSPLKRYAKNVLTGATRGPRTRRADLSHRPQPTRQAAYRRHRQVVAETLELLRGLLPAAIRLEAAPRLLPLVVIGDATQLHQVR